MKRKLFSVVLSVFALLLLMGAAAEPQPTAALLAEEESAVSDETALETEAPPVEPQDPEAEGAVETADDGTPVEESATAVEEAPVGDSHLLIDGQPAPLELGKYYQKGTTYVSASGMVQLLDPAAQIAWDGETMTVTTPQLTLSAKAGQLYVVANGRYLYVPETVQLPENGQLSVPLATLTRAFGASLAYDVNTGVVTVARGSGTIPTGDSFYNTDRKSVV